MSLYPFTPSQINTATATELIAFLKSPTLVARRLDEILAAQEFLGLFLLQGQYQIQGGAIAVPANEKIRTERAASQVNPGAEYKLTPLSAAEYEVYTSMKEGLATEITDEQVSRLLRQPIDDAMTFLHTELVFSANDLALGVVDSSVTQTLAASAQWTTGKQVLKDALRVKQKVKALRLGFKVDTVVLPGEQYAEVIPEIMDLLPDNDDTALTGDFPTLAGITWVSDDDGSLSDPLFIDRSRLGGIAREQIASEEYVKVGDTTGVEIASIREPKADKTRLQARNVHVPIVTNPLAGLHLTGTGA